MQQNSKWSQQEDAKLIAAVKKYGTQWGLVGQEINHTRSQNAIIKRWHGYLRRMHSDLPNTRSQHDRAEEAPRSRAERVERADRHAIEQESDSEMEGESSDDEGMEMQKTEAIKKIVDNDYQYKLNWTEEDDVKLRNVVVNDGNLFWNKIAEVFNTTEEEVLVRWIKCISPKLKNNVKIGGALKWSVNQDYILYAADRNDISHLDLMFFLPYRTVYSIEARWRRICKNSEMIDHLTLLNNRRNLRKEALKKIALKRCLQKRDQMTRVFEREKEANERLKFEQEKYEMMRRPDKVRKLERM